MPFGWRSPANWSLRIVASFRPIWRYGHAECLTSTPSARDNRCAAILGLKHRPKRAGRRLAWAIAFAGQPEPGAATSESRLIFGVRQHATVVVYRFSAGPASRRASPTASEIGSAARASARA